MRTVEQIQAHANQLLMQFGALEYQLRTLTRDRDAVLDQLRAVDAEMGHARTLAQVPATAPTPAPHAEPTPAIVDAESVTAKERIAQALAASGPILSSAAPSNGAAQ